jgi:hypothetical protein
VTYLRLAGLHSGNDTIVGSVDRALQLAKEMIGSRGHRCARWSIDDLVQPPKPFEPLETAGLE